MSLIESILFSRASNILSEFYEHIIFRSYSHCLKLLHFWSFFLLSLTIQLIVSLLQSYRLLIDSFSLFQFTCNLYGLIPEVEAFFSVNLRIYQLITQVVSNLPVYLRIYQVIWYRQELCVNNKK